jgi:hypothetical protein
MSVQFPWQSTAVDSPVPSSGGRVLSGSSGSNRLQHAAAAASAPCCPTCWCRVAASRVSFCGAAAAAVALVASARRLIHAVPAGCMVQQGGGCEERMKAAAGARALSW